MQKDTIKEYFLFSLLVNIRVFLTVEINKHMQKISKLPLKHQFDSKLIFDKLLLAHRALAELKGITGTIPNQDILINTLSMQEAKDSSAIENIITTHDELYKSDPKSKNFATTATKEVYNYVQALCAGFEKVKEFNLLTNNTVQEIQATIEENTAGFRSLPGTTLKNATSGKVVYTPPQDATEVIALMENLETYINDDSICDLDPLIKMAIIHHQFESIHPFYDGNGRTGRIINVLYLVKHDLLQSPILYLTRYINKNKSRYYELLQAVRGNPEAWNSWVMFILDAVNEISQETIILIKSIQSLMSKYKQLIIKKSPKIYSRDLLDTLFLHPYTKIEYLIRDLQIHRNTASKYLSELVKLKLFSMHKSGKDNFYINTALFKLLKGSK